MTYTIWWTLLYSERCERSTDKTIFIYHSASLDDDDGIANWRVFLCHESVYRILMGTRKSNEHNVSLLITSLVVASTKFKAYFTHTRPRNFVISQIEFYFWKVKIPHNGAKCLQLWLDFVGWGTFVRHKCGHISFWLDRFVWFWCDILLSHCRWLNQTRRTNAMKSRRNRRSMNS